MYPSYRAILPVAVGTSAICRRADLLGALVRLKAVAGELVLVSWKEVDAELHLSLPKQPGSGVDIVEAHTNGRANMAFDLVQLAAVVAEFGDGVLDLDVTDRALLIQQANKTGVLASCNWHEDKTAAPSPSTTATRIRLGVK